MGLLKTAATVADGSPTAGHDMLPGFGSGTAIHTLTRACRADPVRARPPWKDRRIADGNT